jgi:ribosomal 50S subunit-associated protein YjgA (DUF615 family)
MSEENKTETTETTKQTVNFSQADYDREKHRARQLEGQLVDIKKQLEPYQKLGDPLDLKYRLSDYEKLTSEENKKPAKLDDKEFESILMKKVEEAKKPLMSEFEKAQNRASELEKRLHSIEVVDRAVDKTSKFFAPDTLPVVKELYFNKYIKKDDDGSFYVVGEDGQIRHKGSQRLTIEDFAEEVLTKHPSFRASSPSNNTRPSGVNSNSAIGTGLEAKLSGVSDKQARVQLIREHKFPQFKK